MKQSCGKYFYTSYAGVYEFKKVQNYWLKAFYFYFIGNVRFH